MSVRDLARLVSIVGHPFLLVPAAIAIATRGSHVDVVQLLGLVIGSLTLVGIVVLIGLRRGRWSHVDVPERKERGPLYAVAIAATFVSTIALAMFGQPFVIVAGSAIALAMLVLGWVINQWVLKVSLHMAMATYSAGIVGPSTIGLAFLGLAVMVGWSRVVLGRHTRQEVLAGFALGLASSLSLLALGRSA